MEEMRHKICVMHLDLSMLYRLRFYYFNFEIIFDKQNTLIENFRELKIQHIEKFISFIYLCKNCKRKMIEI